MASIASVTVTLLLGAAISLLVYLVVQTCKSHLAKPTMRYKGGEKESQRDSIEYGGYVREEHRYSDETTRSIAPTEITIQGGNGDGDDKSVRAPSEYTHDDHYPRFSYERDMSMPHSEQVYDQIYSNDAYPDRKEHDAANTLQVKDKKKKKKRRVMQYEKD